MRRSSGSRGFAGNNGGVAAASPSMNNNPTSGGGRRNQAKSSRALVPVNEAAQAPFPDGFDKREWLQQYKTLKRDLVMEDRDRFRPLIRLKKEQNVKDFLEEVERIEKK